jgi:threonine dehydratase
MQVAGRERAAVRDQLETIGYRFWDETDNAAYRLYLGRTEDSVSE